MQRNFRTSYALLKKWEGGFVDHPADRGGATKYGVTTKTWHAYQTKYGRPLTSVKNLNRKQAKEIAITGYYEPVRFNDLPDGLDMCVVDFAYNSGPHRAVRFLQRALNQIGPYKLKVDGKIGDHTLSIARHVPTKPIIAAYMLSRDMFFKRQSAEEVKAFGEGWNNRLNEVKEAAIKVYDERKAEDKARQAEDEAKERRTGPTGQAAAVAVFLLALGGISWILRKTVGRLWK